MFQPGPPLELPSGSSCPEQSFIESCRVNPIPFIEYMLDITMAPVHERVQDHYTQHTECGVGLHRGCGKTVQTIARVAWEIGKDPTARWKYIQANDGEASKSVDAIRRIIESPRYQHVFPDLVPDPTLWGKTAFRFIIEQVQRDPTCQACGIFGHAGGRATDMVFDDICDLENAVRKAALRAQVKEAYHNTWRKMLTGDRRRVWCIFTPWHVDDITAEWRDAFTREGSLLWEPVKHYESPWHVEFPPDRLMAEEKLNPIAYARAFDLEPMSSEVLIWPAEWLDASMYTERPAHARSGYEAITIDFAFTEKRMVPPKGSSDPDWSVALFAWVDARGHIWIEDMVRMRVTFPQFKRASLMRARSRGVTKGKAEAVAGQRGLVQQLNEDSTFPIDPVERINDKVFRASGLQAFVSDGRCHIKGTRTATGNIAPLPQLQVLYDEMTVFPSGGHDDTVDTVMDMMEMAMGSAAPIPSADLAHLAPNGSPTENKRVKALYG